jgi:hypothetical protein
MTAGPTPDAISRIDAALARIERAANVLSDGHHTLKRRHAKLRSDVADALADLDALIAERAEVTAE